MVKTVQCSIWPGVQCLVYIFCSFVSCVPVCFRAHVTESVCLDFSGCDFFKVDIVAATVDLIVFNFPVLQLQTQLPHHSLEIPVSTIHLDVVLLQLLLVADYLSGGKFFS